MTFPMKERLFGATITNPLATPTGLLINQTMLVMMNIVVLLAGKVSPMVNGTTMCVTKSTDSSVKS